MSNKNNSSPIYDGQIDGIEFYIQNDKQNAKDSFVSIVNKELFTKSMPSQGGVYDAKMGTTDHVWNCTTCQDTKEFCPGHPGSLTLNYPVQAPMCIKEIFRWLKITCFNCGALLITKEIKTAKFKKLADTIKAMNNNNKNLKCFRCDEIHPFVTREKQDNITIYTELYKENGVVEKKKLHNHKIREILERISDEDVARMGKNPLNSHPKNFILWTLYIPPNTIRPDIQKIGGIRSNNNDITTLVKKLVEFNEKLPGKIPSDADLDGKFSDFIQLLNMAYYEMVKGSINVGITKLKIQPDLSKSFASIASRLPRKQGRLRQNLMGRRVNYMMRSVITCDNSLRIDEVGVPLIIAKNIQIPEIVQEYNIHIMQAYFLNGRDQYPGCSAVIKGSKGRPHAIEVLRRSNYMLQVGDTIMRDIISGDVMDFNRQPSLLFTAISCHTIRVLSDSDTLRMNVSACNLYNADFDGDCMNGMPPRSTMSRNEIRQLSGVGRWFISYKDSKPTIGMFQDGLLGVAEFTRDDIDMNRYHTMQMFRQTDAWPVIENKPNFNSREVMSLLLPEINYTGRPSMYNSGHGRYIKYSESEINVEVKRGKLVRGVIDKSTVGQGQAGGILHIIHNEYGSAKALEVAYGMQQIANVFLINRGYTVGVYDCMLNDAAIKKIHEVESNIIAESELLTEELNFGKLVPPLGVSLEQYYEGRQMEILRPGDDFIENILKSIDPRNNSLYKMIVYGSKGQINNLYSICSAIGQTSIDGGRIKPNFGFKRTLPYFTRYETTPESRGYVGNSFLTGLSPTEFFFQAMDARVSFIRNALSTSITGEQNRKSIKNLETIIVNNTYKASKINNVIQFLYGGDGLDPRRIEKVDFPTIKLSNADLESGYRCTLADVDKIFRNKNVEEALVAEFEQIKKDREIFRNIFMTIEAQSDSLLMQTSLHMPVNVKRVINDTLYSLQTVDKSDKLSTEAKAAIKDRYAASDKLSTATKIVNPIEMLNQLNDWILRLPYVLINSIQENKRSTVPMYIRKSFTMFEILLRTHLNVKNFIRLGINSTSLEIILTKIRSIYSQALIDYGTAVGIIAAQSISEPMTQFILDSKHRTGSGEGRKTSGIAKVKEIFGAKMPSGKNTMVLMIKKSLQSNENEARKIANHIEMLPFRRFVNVSQIFFEKYAMPVHPQYKHEIAMIKNFEKHNPSKRPPSNLVKWCLRYELNKTQMILKNIKLETIIRSLELANPDSFIVYTQENADYIVIRMYFRNSIVTKGRAINLDKMEQMEESILNTIVRGTEGISSAGVKPILKSKINEDGSITEEKIYFVETSGTNMSAILANDYIDKNTAQSDSVTEMFAIFGIEAARQKIINELKQVIAGSSYRHYTLYADEMTYTGVVTSIERTGLGKRERNNILLRMSNGSPLEILQDAAINNMTDTIGGISAAIVVGRAPFLGSMYNDFALDEEFINSNRVTVESLLSDL